MDSDDINKVFIVIGSIIVTYLIIWGMYWLTKTFTYWLFYEDMVKETIKELVNQKYLLTP